MLLSSSAAGVTVTLELGPVGRQPLSSSSASAIYKAFASTSAVSSSSSSPDQSSAGKVILLPYNEFNERVRGGTKGLGNAEMLPPAGTPTAVVVAVVVETAGSPQLWLLSCATDEVDVGWAKTLLNAPLCDRQVEKF
jgi:hypothetical protein